MEIMDETPVEETIKEKYDQLFIAEKKVADYILTNPDKAVNANVSELASLSDVSDATIVRFCKHIGYQGYYQLRICLSRDLGRMIGKQKLRESTISSLFQSFAYQLIEIGKKSSDEKMQECVNMLKTCRYVHIIAVGNTIPLAQYFGFRLGRLGIRSTYHSLPEYALNSINLAQEGDIVFAISKSGSSKQVVQAMELARKRNLKVIAVTECEYSPVSQQADCLLLSSSEKHPFDYIKEYSHLMETVIIDAILHFATDENVINSEAAVIPEILSSETKY
jgi:Transcriptional regulators